MKKVMIALLAIAVVFGFAACNNESGAPAGNTELRVDGIAETTKEYLPGEKIVPADFTFTAWTVDGEKVSVPAEQVMGEYVAALDSADTTGVERAMPVTFSGNGVIFKGVANVYKPTAIEVNADAVEKSYYATTSDLSDAKYSKIDLEGAVITVTYSVKGVEKEREIAPNDLITAALNGSAKFSTPAEKVDVDVKYAFDATGLTAVKAFSIEIKKNYIDSVALELKDTVETPIYVDATIDQNKIDMVATWLNGEETTLTVDEDYKYVDSNGAYTQATVTVDTSEAGSETVKASYCGKNGKPGMTAAEKAASLDIDVVSNEVTGIKASITKAEVAKGAKAEDTEGYGITVKYVLADGSTDEKTAIKYGAAANGFSVNPEEITADVNSNITVTVTVDNWTTTIDLLVVDGASAGAGDGGDGGQ